MSVDFRKAHLFTHAGCMDGSAAGLLFIHAGGDIENIHWVSPNVLDDRITKFIDGNDRDIPILIVDAAPSMGLAMRLAIRGNVHVIDHHATNSDIDGLGPNFFIDTKNEACGCENFRRWLVRNDVFATSPPPYPYMGFETTVSFDHQSYRRLTTIIDDHDRWQHKIPFSMQVAKFFSFVGQKDFVQRFMDIRGRFAEEKAEYWTPFEKDLMRLVCRIQETKFKNAMEKMQVRSRRIGSRDWTFAYIISDEVNNSEMLNMYLNEHPEVDAAVQISFGLQKVAMRSKDRIDVGQLCRQYGGGGHKNAAGHPLPSGMIEEIVGKVNV